MCIMHSKTVFDWTIRELRGTSKEKKHYPGNGTWALKVNALKKQVLTKFGAFSKDLTEKTLKFKNTIMSIFLSVYTCI